ncbi:MAG: reactive intermediate/imine deaminase [Gammaproteobacteria bacterium]|jgi:reactive intermediate/imine deaminase|tara:strand:+ start:6218 stop:6598 length:381 start_codon:yes stop_codon:yes gene_type:complete
MPKLAIHTNDAPAAIGAYTQAIKAGDTVYISGQIPLDPASGDICSSDIGAQIHQVFKNMTAVAAAAGGTLADAVKVTVYLTDLGNFAAVNDIMAEYFPKPFPARAALEVSALPKGSLVEADAILSL